MENKKSPHFSEQEMITHIKFITRSLIQPNSSNHQQPSRASPPHSFLRTLPNHPKVEYSPRRDSECYHQVKQRVTGSPWSDEKKRKRKPIFTATNSFWNGSPQTITSKHQTPLMDRINKSIYDRFKTQTKELQQLTKDNRKTKEETSEIWKQFLKRENEWIEDRKKVYQEMKFIEEMRYSSYSPQKSRSRKRVSPARVDLNQVQWSIQQLRQQTQELRGKILTRNEKESPKVKHGNPPINQRKELRKTFHT